jgi:hypothetical protein
LRKLKLFSYSPACASSEVCGACRAVTGSSPIHA